MEFKAYSYLKVQGVGFKILPFLGGPRTWRFRVVGQPGETELLSAGPSDMGSIQKDGQSHKLGGQVGMESESKHTSQHMSRAVVRTWPARGLKTKFLHHRPYKPQIFF